MRRPLLRGIRVGPLGPLRRVLHEWLFLMEEKKNWPKNDAPWWYNERAVLSLFAGAVWTCGGWAFEEYATSKRMKAGRQTKYGGRGDISFRVRGQRFEGEAKACSPSISRGPSDPLAGVRKCLDEACDAAKRLPRARGYRQIGIVFVSPCLRASQVKEWRDQVEAFIQSLPSLEDVALAWTFPGSGIDLKVGGYIYPGAVLVLRPLGGRREPTTRRGGPGPSRRGTAAGSRGSSR